MVTSVQALQRIQAGENQKILYDLLATKRMTMAQIVAATSFPEATIKQYLRLMTNKYQVIKDKSFKHVYYYANPAMPFEFSRNTKMLMQRVINKEAKRLEQEAKPIVTTPPHTHQVNAHTRIVRLMDKPMLNSTMPRKKTGASKFVSMGSGLSLFKNWE